MLFLLLNLLKSRCISILILLFAIIKTYKHLAFELIRTDFFKAKIAKIYDMRPGK